MYSRIQNLKCKPPLPPNLNKENVGLWVGWTCKNDREVVREAATKGVDLNLVYLFLSQRKNCNHEISEEYFRNEVILWVNELLNRKQIFRALHVLKNVQKDPEEELSKVFYVTKNTELREYIGDHLKKQNKLEERLLHLEHFLDLILKNTLLTSRFKLPAESIECLEAQDVEWKAGVAAKLFLRTFDTILMSFLTADSLWNQLLIYNDYKLLTSWVNLHYGQSSSSNINENLQKTFKIYPITDEMVQELFRLDVSPKTKENILNELCKYGILCRTERSNLNSLLKRFVLSRNINFIHEILEKSTSNITTDEFLHLLTGFCIENQLFTVLNAVLEKFHLSENLKTEFADVDLIVDCRDLEKHCTKDALQNNIYKISKYLSKGNLESYFSENPLMLLSLILFSDKDIVEIIETRKVLLFNQTFTKSVSKMFKEFKLLELIHNRQSIVKSCDLTYYDMLEKHLNLDVKKCFAYHFENKPYPHFGDQYLIEKYGYTKKINQIFYVREQRPSIACKYFMVDQYMQFGCIPDESVKILKKKIYKLAMKNFSSEEIGSSCVAFLEMVGLSSEFVRVCLLGANILLDSGNDFEDIVELFLNLENDPYVVLRTVEDQVMDSIDFDNFNKAEIFIEAIKNYDLIVRFSMEYNLKLPEMFLRTCAQNNLWLPFLIYAQLKNYPTEQIKLIVHGFKNPTLAEHILHSVMHDFQLDEQNIMRDRDSRKAFLSRIGVRASLENITWSGSMNSSFYSRSSYGSSSGSSGSDFLEIDISNTKTTLLQVLIKSHNSRDPPRALLQACQLYRCPLLAIVATSYEPDSYITNWLTWLGVSCRQYEVFTNFEAMASNSQLVSALLNDCMNNRFPKTLQQSFEIFLPDNPLEHVLKFLNLCIQQKFKMTNLAAQLDNFKSSLARCRRYSVVPEIDNEMTFLKSKGWIEKTALLLLSSAIHYNMNSTYEQILFLKALSELQIEKYFNCPNLNRLLDILETICELQPTLRFDVTSYFDQKDGRKPVVDCINTFLDHLLFDGALKIAQIEGLPPDLILIKQWQDKFQNSYKKSDIEFWKESNDIFTCHNVTADCVVEFYMENFERVETNWEKYNLLKLAQYWAVKFELSNQYELEKRKWYYYIMTEENWRTEKNEEHFDCLPLSVTFKEMLEMLDNFTPFDEEEISEDFLKIVQDLINEVLRKDNIWLALKLEKIFKCKNDDLERLKVGFSLGEGLLMPYQMDIEQRLLFTDIGHYRRLEHRRLYTSTRLSTASSASFSLAGPSRVTLVDNVEIPVDETLALLSTLTEKVANGSNLACTILRAYRISVNIEVPYHVVISTPDSMKLLRDVLEDDCVNKLDVVHDFCAVFKWTKKQISDFICEEIIAACLKYINSKTDEFILWDLKMDQEFYLVLQLLQENCSLLGRKLYMYANTLHKSQLLADLDFKISEISLIVELLIKAHDCFTADCNIEGISSILKKCKTVVNYLVTLRSWKLIVRLLTGVGRYTDMKYVFNILKENDQFEFLLSKGSKKDSNLKNALLTYLRKFCPDNRELYKLVALHFALFSEVAMLWEREAQSVIKNLIEISKLEMENNKLDPKTEPFVLLSNSDGTRICLNRAMQDYTHATEFHLKGEKLGKALTSARQAELVALQISLLKGLPSSGTATCILNLNNAQILSLVCNQLCFYQTSIVVESYQYHLDWSTVLYEKCIIKHDLDYLHVFLKHHPLDESFVHDISRKFISDNINTLPEINCMKNVLNHLLSVHAKYRIASELGFTDIVEDLLSSGQLAYLKDTVWKKGYKSETDH